MNAHEQRRRNDATGLHHLHCFGWLRTVELGKLMWPQSPASRQAADRLARSWIERRLVICRDLPDGAGRALMLATAGVKLLAEEGVAAASGKDIGRFPSEGWLPPASWRHDLIACGVLCALHQRGYRVIPEAQIRRLGERLAKVPDGLATKDETVIWLEVENARKTGPEMRRLAEALVAVASGKAALVAGVRPSTAMVAFLPSALDERGHVLSHQERVRKAVATYAQSDLTLYWAACTPLGTAGVGSVDFSSETIHSDRTARILKILESSGWSVDDDGSLTVSYAAYRAFVWKDEQDHWSYCVETDAGLLVEPAAYAESITMAKRGAASVLARMPVSR